MEVFKWTPTVCVDDKNCLCLPDLCRAAVLLFLLFKTKKVTVPTALAYQAGHVDDRLTDTLKTAVTDKLAALNSIPLICIRIHDLNICTS